MSAAAARLTLRWRSDAAVHADALHFNGVGADALAEQLGIARAGPRPAAQALGLPDADPALRFTVPASAFGSRRSRFTRVEPRLGRWYPITMLDEASRPEGMTAAALRIVAVDAESLCVDANHPLAGRAFEATVESAPRAPEPPGFEEPSPRQKLTRWLTSGPGLQALDAQARAAYLDGEALRRDDERDDALFYQAPRMVQHIDAHCRSVISERYAAALRPDGRILDLLSSWVSHLPDEPAQREVVGIGLNGSELAANPRLSAFRVQDLNGSTTLPFPDGYFDTAVCTVSVEYLVNPHAVFREVARTLRPGGHFVCSFSERWFPPKAIRVWAALHPFERMALVAGVFHDAGGFETPHTWSLRGAPRPPDDDYAGQMAYADPVYTVSATAAA